MCVCSDPKSNPTARVRCWGMPGQHFRAYTYAKPVRSRRDVLKVMRPGVCVDAVSDAVGDAV